MQVTFDPGQAPDSTSRNLHKTSVRDKFRGVFFANRLSFIELFDDISLLLNVRILCVVDSFISAAKVCNCVIPHGVDRYV